MTDSTIWDCPATSNATAKAGQADFFGQGGQPVHATGCQNDDGAFFGKEPGCVRAEAGGGAGDENDLVLKGFWHDFLYWLDYSKYHAALTFPAQGV